MTDPLVGLWLATVGLGTPEALRVGTDLLARWTEPHRHYHTVDHLATTLSIVDAHAELAEDPDAVRLALWFHDAVCDPRATDNEERSAVLAVEALTSLGVSPHRVAEVARLIRLTTGHAVPPEDRNGALLADADLAILAAPPPDYDRYAAAVRREYAHVPDDAFRAGRATVLRHLLALPELYRVVPQRAEWAAQASANLRRELAGLTQ
jgi:predicted metal-dependent HD superfamily phosphohydrolase